jgi:predicted permease
MIRDLLQDLRYGARTLRRSPGFTAMVVLTLALGVGGNGAIFSLLNALFLRPLPVAHPESLVLFSDGASPGLSTVLARGRLDLFSYPLYQRLHADEGVFTELAAQQSGTTNSLVRWGGSAEGQPADPAVGRSVSANFFAVLGVPAHRGRTFLPEDEATPGAPPALVLSHGYWQRRFGGDPRVIGATVTVDARQGRVVGVTPPGFTGLEVGSPTDFWMPIAASAPPYLASARHRWLYLVGRTKPGVAMATAQARANVSLQQFLAEHGAEAWFNSPDAGTPQQVRLALERGATGMSALRKRFRDPLLALTAGVGLLLLIVCLNVSHLLLARAVSRQREMSIRAALGAGRARVVRQLLAEGLLLSALGGGAGVLVTTWLREGLLALASSGEMPLPLDVRSDVRVLAFTAALALATALLLGLVPARQAWRADLQRALAATSHAVTAGGSRRLVSRVLLASQVALALVLLFGAGLLAGSLRRLREVPGGFDERHLLVANMNPGLTGLRGEPLVVLYDDLLRRVTALPGVRSASLSTNTLLSGHRMFRRILARGTISSSDPTEPMEVGWSAGIVTPGYFETVGMTMAAGRSLGREDHANAPRVAVVNQALARRFFRGAEVLGKRFRFGGDDPSRPDIEVVGIVEDARSRSLREEPEPTVYVPVAQSPFQLQSLEVRARDGVADPAALLAAIRRAMQETHPSLVVRGVRTMRDQRERSVVLERLLATLSSAFGLAAIFLVSLGLYGVIAQWAAQRTREIGVRVALGAAAAGVRWMVMRQALVLVLAGVVVGLPAAMAASRLLKAFLFGVTPMDPATLAGAALALFAVATAAAYLPARRASRVDPMVALRAE